MGREREAEKIESREGHKKQDLNNCLFEYKVDLSKLTIARGNIILAIMISIADKIARIF